MHTMLISTPRRPRRKNSRGSVLVEAALVISLIFVPMALGVATVGLNLVRATQTNQINRDAGHMFARGVDLSGDPTGLVNQGIILQMAPALKTPNATAVLILSHIIYIAPDTCKTCSYTCSNCANLNHAAFDQQIVLGNSALKASVFGTVAAGSKKDSTSGQVADSYGNTAVRADGVLTYLTLGVADTLAKDVYVSETYHSSADLAIPGFFSPAGTYAQAFF